MIGETITVTREGAPDPENLDDLGFPIVGAPTTFTFVTNSPCAPLYASETPEEAGPLIITGYRIIGPADLTLVPSDLLTIRSVPGWQVEGEVGRWDRPSNAEPWGTEFVVRRAS